MAGDNAIAVGMAAAGLHQSQRRKAVMAGIAAASLLRILFAIFAVQLLHFTGLMAAGGLLLAWVAWKMFRDIRHQQRIAKGNIDAPREAPEPKKFFSAIMQIIIADLSMSLDNVLAVAGVARDHLIILSLGLALSVLLMGVAATLVARISARFPWFAYLGLGIVAYTALHMIIDGLGAVLGRLG
jgi:YjbE family integral membrane protein